MVPKVRTVALAIFATLATSITTSAHDYVLGPLKVSHPWARATPTAAPVAAGYLTVTNAGADPDRLIGLSSPVAQKLEIHESQVVDGIARMRRLAQGVEIAPGASVTLKPGSAHIMFINPASPFTKDKRLPVTLTFEKAGSITVEFAVEGLDAATPPENHDSHGP